MLKNRATKTLTKRILSMLAAIILTAGSVYAPVYAAAGDGIVPDTNMTHVSEGNVIPDGDAQEGSTENDEPTETGNDEELSSEEESSVTTYRAACTTMQTIIIHKGEEL